ncbi:hypothetical protein Hanom_Chr12g01147261 [Helianthus anomalus]
MQGDDVSNNHSACREILGGLGTPFVTARARGLPRQNGINQLSSMLVESSIIVNATMEDYNVLARREEETIWLRVKAEAMVKAAREGVKQLEKDKAAFDKLKQTETWAASADLKQVRSLAKLLSDERKGWREACARENEKLFHVRKELNNLKAANAALVKEKAAAEAAVKEAEARGAKVLEEADTDRAKLNKAVEEHKVEVQNQVTIIEEVSARAIEAEARAREVEEAKDGLATSLSQVTADHLWMREHGIGHIVGTILDAPENVSAVSEMNDHTEAAYAVAVDGYNKLSILALEDIEKCLQAEDYVDCLRLLFDLPEEDEDAGGVKNDAVTSGTEAD